MPTTLEGLKKAEPLAHCFVDKRFEYSNDLPRLRFADGGRLLKLSFARSQAADWNSEHFCKRGGVRGKCKGFSFGSRRRMLDRLNSVSVASTLPVFFTATLPDDVFNDCASQFAKQAKEWLDVFLKRLRRVCPSACGFWRIEWQTRKSGCYEGKLVPHFHLLVWGLPTRELGERDVKQDGINIGSEKVFEAYVDAKDAQQTLELVGILGHRGDPSIEALPDGHCKISTSWAGVEYTFSGKTKFVNRCGALLNSLVVNQFVVATPEVNRARYMSFADWASLAWYHVVGSHNTDHLTAGVRVERVKSWGGVMSYCAKYMAKSDCGFLAEVQFGRSWGVFNRASVPWAKMVDISLDGEEGVRIRRIARRYLEHRFGRSVRASHGITVYCDVQQFRKLWERPPPDPF